jgi:hypothetical protein
MALAASGHLAYDALCFVSFCFSHGRYGFDGGWGATEHIFIAARTRSRRTCVGIKLSTSREEEEEEEERYQL